MKKIAVTFLVIVLIAAVGATFAYFLAKKYEPEVRDIVVYEVNRLLDVEVSVEDINLSLLQRFPYASLRFSHVVIPETYSPNQVDTLLYARDIYLQISLWDFLRKQYRISEAEINGGFMHMAVYKNGKDNYQFWKTTESADPAVLSLNDINFKNFHFSYKQEQHTDLSIEVHKAHAQGMFGSEVYEIKADCELTLYHFALGEDTMYHNMPVKGDLGLNINNLSHSHELNAERLQIGKEKLQVSGHFNPNDHNSWGLVMRASGAQIEHIIELLPNDMRRGLRAYKARGSTDIVFEMSDADNAALSIDFLFDKTKGSFQHDIALGKAAIDKAAGSLQVRGEVVSLYIDHIHGGIGPGKLKMNGSIRNFNAPQFDLAVDGNVDLREVRNFFNLDYLEEMKGKVSLTGTFRGALPANANTENLVFLRGVDFDGKIFLKDGALRMRDSDAFLEQINGEVALKNNSILVKEGSAEVNGNKFNFNGNIVNALPYLVRDDQKLHIEADFRAKTLDLNRIWNTSSSKRDTTYQFSLPQMVTFDFSLDLGEVNFRRFTAKKIEGTASYKNNLLILNPIRFRLASGVATGSASVRKLTETKYVVSSGFQLKQMNISELFYAFENFGQTMVTEQKISGTADARVRYESNLSSDLSLDLASIVSQIDLEVMNGKLRNVEALTDVAEYLRGNLVWKSLVRVDAFEKQLASVQFDTLRNSIDIKNRVVYIPSMRVGSSALTLNLSGQHDFDNNIDYRLSFRLSELFKTGKPRQEEFGYIVDDQTGLRLYLQMSGTVDDPIFNLDKDGARQKRKDDFQREKSTFKGILKEEFGLFKSDTTLSAPTDKTGKTGPVYSVEWDGFEKGKDSLKTPEKKPTKPGILKTKDKKQYEELEEDDDL